MAAFIAAGENRETREAGFSSGRYTREPSSMAERSAPRTRIAARVEWMDVDVTTCTGIGTGMQQQVVDTRSWWIQIKSIERNTVKKDPFRAESRDQSVVVLTLHMDHIREMSR